MHSKKKKLQSKNYGNHSTKYKKKIKSKSGTLNKSGLFHRSKVRFKKGTRFDQTKAILDISWSLFKSFSKLYFYVLIQLFQVLDKCELEWKILIVKKKNTF